MTADRDVILARAGREREIQGSVEKRSQGNAATCEQRLQGFGVTFHTHTHTTQHPCHARHTGKFARYLGNLRPAFVGEKMIRRAGWTQYAG